MCCSLPPALHMLFRSLYISLVPKPCCQGCCQISDGVEAYKDNWTERQELIWLEDVKVLVCLDDLDNLVIYKYIIYIICGGPRMLRPMWS